MKPLPNKFDDDIERAIEKSLETLRENGWRFFELDVDLMYVLDLRNHPGLADEYLMGEWREPTITCTRPVIPKDSQIFGLAAFMAGFSAILRPSAFLRNLWDVEDYVLDIFCPNLHGEDTITWNGQ